MKPKKIAILTPTFSYYSGIDRVVQLQAEDYVKKGDKVTVFALEGGIKSNKYKVEILGMPKSSFWQRIYRLFFFLDLKKLNCYKKLEDYDIVISHFYPMNLLASLARKHFKIKYIYHNHGINTIAYNNIFQKIYMNLFLFFNNLSIKNVDEAFSVSDFLKKELKKQSSLNSIVVYNKIDNKRFNRKVIGNKIIKKYNLKGNKVLLYVGRIAPYKGIHLLLKSFNKIKKEISNIKLLIVGKKTYDKYMDDLIKITNKDVIFTGFVDDKDLPNYYAACDVYVTASLWEGFDLPIAEAQACGKKVVAFDVGSHPEVVKNGILVEKENVNRFSEAVLKLLRK